MSDLPVKEQPNLRPICPHCEQPIDCLLLKKLESNFLSAKVVYCCPNCKKVLGFTDRKSWLAG